jgi:hypothetical protein
MAMSEPVTGEEELERTLARLVQEIDRGDYRDAEGRGLATSLFFRRAKALVFLRGQLNGEPRPPPMRRFAPRRIRLRAKGEAGRARDRLAG